jgi:hypothetical protein
MNRIYGQSTRRLWPHAGGNGRLRAYHSPRGLLCAPVTSQDGAAYARGGKGKMVPSQAAGLAKGGIARPAAGQRRCQRHHNRRHHRHRSGRSRGHSRRHERSQSSPKSQAQQPLPQQALSQQASSPQALSQQASQRRSLCIGFRWLSGGVTLDSRGQSSHHPSGRTFTTPSRDQASATFLRGVFRGAEPGTRDFGPGPPARRSATRASGRPAHDPCIRRDAGLSG